LKSSHLVAVSVNWIYIDKFAMVYYNWSEF